MILNPSVDAGEANQKGPPYSILHLISNEKSNLQSFFEGGKKN